MIYIYIFASDSISLEEIHHIFHEEIHRYSGLGEGVKDKLDIKTEELSSHLSNTNVAATMPAGTKGGKRSRRY